MISLDAYTDFASVYDTFMDETPYEEWAEFIHELIKEYGISEVFGRDLQGENCSDKQKVLDSERNLVLDLGCGTGTLTELLYRRGYDMIGVDYSQDMLNIAMEKKAESGSDILYLCQDMREIEETEENEVEEAEEVEETFRRVNNYLYPGGIFIFDFNTVYKYEQIIGDTTIAENRENCSFIWENYYHEEERINEYDLTIFVQEEEELFRRFSETHYQRGYTLDEMKALVEKAGLRFMKAIDADTHEEPDEFSERIYIIAGEQGK